MCKGCAACPAGKFKEATGSAACASCAQGREAPAPGALKCTACAKSTFQDQTGVARCKVCSTATGGERPQTKGGMAGATSVEDCTAGVARLTCGAGFGASSNGTCVLCLPGYFQTGNNSTKPCERCGCSKFSSAGATSCDSTCPAGAFGNITTGTCEPCPLCASGVRQECSGSSPGYCGACEFKTYFNASTGSCAACPAGHWCLGGVKILCEAGFRCAVGERVPCTEPGLFCPTAGLAAAQTCPVGAACTAEGVVRVCAATEVSSGGTCTRCPDSTFSRNNTCVGCPKNAAVTCLKGEVDIERTGHFCPQCTHEAALLDARTRFYPCRIAGACITELDATDHAVRTRCAPRYEGLLCDLCQPGFGKAAGFCTACPSHNMMVVGLVAYLAIATFVAVAVTKRTLPAQEAQQGGTCSWWRRLLPARLTHGCCSFFGMCAAAGAAVLYTGEDGVLQGRATKMSLKVNKKANSIAALRIFVNYM